MFLIVCCLFALQGPGVTTDEDLQILFEQMLVLRNQGKFERALFLLQERRSWPGFSRGQTARVDLEIGRLLMEKRNFAEAEKAFFSALEQTDTHCDAAVGLGQLYNRSGNYSRARQYLAQATGDDACREGATRVLIEVKGNEETWPPGYAAEALPDAPARLRAEADQFLGKAAGLTGVRAIETFQKALIRYQKLNDFIRCWAAMGAMGQIYEKMKNYRAASILFAHQAIVSSWAPSDMDPLIYLAPILNLARTQMAKGDFRLAREALMDLLALCRTKQLPYWTSVTLHDLGQLELSCRRYEQARYYFKEVIGLNRVERDALDYQRLSYKSIALSYRFQADMPNARIWNERRYAWELKGGNRVMACFGLLDQIDDLFLLYQEQSNPKEQLDQVQHILTRLLALARETQNKALLVQALWRSGDLALKRNDDQAVITLAERGIQLLENHQGPWSGLGQEVIPFSPDEMRWRLSLLECKALARLGNPTYKRKLALLEEIAGNTVERKVRVNYFEHLMWAYLVMEKPRKALDYAAKALESYDAFSKQEDLFRMRFIRGVQIASHMLHEPRRFDQVSIVPFDVLEKPIYSMIADGAFAKAEKALINLLQEFEAIRQSLQRNFRWQVAFADIYAHITGQIQYVLIEQGKIEEALYWAEWSRSRMTTGKTIDSKGTVPHARIDELVRNSAEHQTTIVFYSLIYQTQLDFMTADPRARELQEHVLYTWLIRSGKIEFVELNLQHNLHHLKQYTLEECIRLFHCQVRNANFGVCKDRQEFKGHGGVSHLLYRSLIQSLEPFLPAGKQAEPLLVVPDGVLHMVPFSALTDHTGTSLIEKYSLQVLPGLSLIQARQHREPGKEQINLIAGVPKWPEVYDPWTKQRIEISDLPGARFELSIVNELLPGSTNVLVGGQATETAVKAAFPEARLIHLATHGLPFDASDSGEPGFVLLGASADDDGFLTASEIGKMTLQADLVTLSACYSGAGRLSSEGLLGLGRAFLTAGANRLLLNLWQVSDAAAIGFMSHFYKELTQALPPHLAFRNAVLTLRKTYPDPKYWAGFTFISGVLH